MAFDAYMQSLSVGMTTIEELFSVGPTHHLIGHPHTASFKCGAFAMAPIQGFADAIGPDRSLWAADAPKQKSLTVRPTHKGIVPAGVGSELERQDMRTLRSTVFYARNLRWTSQALVVASTTRPVMGGRSWTALMHEDNRVRQAFALWANSTLGMLVHWTQGQRTQTGRSPTQIGAVRKMPCPKLDQLASERLDEAAETFDRLYDKTLLPACQAHADNVRQEIDYAVLKMLGLEGGQQTVDTLRWLWCHEPSVHGRDKTAVKMLDQG